MTSRNTSKTPLTDLQQAILDFIWKKGASTSEEVREGLLPRHPLKDPSVRTMLRRMEERGYISHSVEGKLFVYRANVHAQSMAARAVQHIIERFCAGSAEQFLVGMVDENIVSMKTIRKLAKKVKKGRQV